MEKLTTSDNCKFCGYSLAAAPPCERGSYEDEDGEVIVELCGHLACPACFSCQGREDVTPNMVRVCKEMREIFERYPRCQPSI